MQKIPEFILYLSGEPVVYIIGGVTFMLFINVARGVIFGEKKVYLEDLFHTVKEHDFTKKGNDNE